MPLLPELFLEYSLWTEETHKYFSEEFAESLGFKQTDSEDFVYIIFSNITILIPDIRDLHKRL